MVKKLSVGGVLAILGCAGIATETPTPVEPGTLSGYWRLLARQPDGTLAYEERCESPLFAIGSDTCPKDVCLHDLIGQPDVMYAITRVERRERAATLTVGLLDPAGRASEQVWTLGDGGRWIEIERDGKRMIFASPAAFSSFPTVVIETCGTM